MRGFYTLIQLYSNQLTDVGDFGSRDLVVHLQTVLLEKNYVLITLLKNNFFTATSTKNVQVFLVVCEKNYFFSRVK